MVYKHTNKYVTPSLKFGDHLLFDYNELIEQYSELSENEIIQVTYFLNSTCLKIKPSKQQFIIIKEALKKIPIELKSQEFKFINNYPDYVVSSCNNENEIEQIYLSIFKPLTKTPLTILPPHEIISIINSNKHHFSNNLKCKIIDELFKMIYQTTEINIQKENRFIYIIEILKLLNVGNNDRDNNEIFKKQEIQITELIKSSSSPSLFKEITNYSATHKSLLSVFDYSISEFMPLNIIDWIIQLFGNQVDITLYTDLLLLASQFKENNYFNYIDKYQNQIINSLNNDKTIVYIGELNDEMFRKQFEPIVSILIKSKQFNVIQFEKLVKFKYNNINFKRLEEIFCDWFQYDILVEILVELRGLKLIKQFDLNKYIHCNFHYNRISMDYKLIHKSLSTYQINEDKFINKLGQDEFTLFEIYKSNFKYLFSYQLIDIDYIIPIIFSNLSTSSIKKSFLSDKIEYLIEISNLNIINNWILPNFNDECLKSKTYQLKSNSGINLQSIDKQLSNVLIDEIFKQYLNNNSTSMYQKLQLSLVSKISFLSVKSIINGSMNIPIPITSLSNCCDEYSLLDCNSIKYLKYYTVPRSEDKQLYTILNKCNSIEILQLSFTRIIGTQILDYKMVFNWLNWYNSSNGGNGKLKKLIFQIDFEINIVQAIQEFQLLNSDIDISIQMGLHDSISKNDKPIIEFDKLNITNLETSIEYYFSHGFLNTAGISTISNLKLSIDFNYNRVEDDLFIMYFKKYGKNWINHQDGSTSLSNLKSLELIISADHDENSGHFRFYKELFNYFGSKISSNLNEIIISFSSLIDNHSIIEMIFKLICNNPLFNSVSQITIPSFYTNSILHSLNKLSTSSLNSFIQQPLSFNRSNSIEFIRNIKEIKQVDQIKNNKRCFGEIGNQQDEDYEDDDSIFNSGSDEEIEYDYDVDDDDEDEGEDDENDEDEGEDNSDEEDDNEEDEGEDDDSN